MVGGCQTRKGRRVTFIISAHGVSRPRVSAEISACEFYDRRIALAKAKSASAKASVFLAHSTADDGSVNVVVLFFRDSNAHVYVDDYDTAIPNRSHVDRKRTDSPNR